MTHGAPRRPPLWSTVVATWFGTGLSPVAPGTCGTLGAIPLAWAIGRQPLAIYLAVTAAIVVVGSIAADVYCDATGKHDNQRIVVDEVAGYLVTLAPVARSPLHLALAFGLFRLFDIWKPPPVRWIDRHVKGGFGVVADDLGAGVYAGLVLWLLAHYAVVERALAWVRR